MLLEILQQYFGDFSETQIKQFAALQDLYTEWNKKINVISRKDMDNFYEHHVLHSLSITTQFEFTKGMQVMDLGCGGGFPGIPLAIFYPETHFHLVDSINKKLKVAAEIAAAIGLQNITTQHTRAEDIKNHPQDTAGKFDTVISRAVAPLKNLWQWSKPLLKNIPVVQVPDTEVAKFKSGLFCLKGGDLATEIQESGTRPHIFEIEGLFSEEYFKEKYLLYVPR